MLGMWKPSARHLRWWSQILFTSETKQLFQPAAQTSTDERPAKVGATLSSFQKPPNHRLASLRRHYYQSSLVHYEQHFKDRI